MKKKMLSILLCLAMTAGLLTTAAWATGTEHKAHCVCGVDTAAETTHTHDVNTEWVGITSLDEITSEHTHYYLKNNVTTENSWNPMNKTVLCLNGHSIICDDSKDTISINADNRLTLTDCSANESGKITHTYGKTGRGIANKGTVILWRGSISDNIIKSVGAGIYNGPSAYFYMFGGSVANNTTTEYNHGAGVYNEGKINMYSGAIRDNFAAGSGGGIFNYKGIIEMNGTASIRNNCTDSQNKSASGGGVDNYLGTFIMKGGEISENTANSAAGVNNYADTISSKDTKSASFIMTGGTIFGNKADSVGGGVFNSADKDATLTFNVSGNSVIRDNKAKKGGGIGASGGGVTMTLSENAAIKDNTADSTELRIGDGGGVYLNGSSYSGSPVFNQNGGTVSGNNARRGGGIYVGGGKLNAAGGSITDNTANFGGGVHMLSRNTITLSGKVNITGNKCKTDSKDNNLYLNTSELRVSAAELTDGANIGISTATKPTTSKTLTITDDTVKKDYFVSDDSDYETAIDSDGYVVLRMRAETCTVKIILPDGDAVSRSESGGALEQTKEKDKAIDDVVLTAADGYYFSQTDINNINNYTAANGIQLAVVGTADFSQVRIFGTPKRDLTLNITVTAKKAQAAPNVSGIAPTDVGGKGYIKGTTDEMEYRLKGTLTWIDCCFDDENGEPVEAGKTYEVRRKANATLLASPIAEVTVPAYISKVSEPAPKNYTYDGQEHIGITTGDDYAVSSGTNSAVDAGTYTVYIKPADGKQWNDGTADAKKFIWKIEKAGRTAPAGLSGVSPTASGASDGKIIGVTADMEYRKTGGSAWISCTDTEISNLAAGKYEVRYKETANYKAGETFAVTVPNGVTPVYVLTVLGGNGSGSYENNTTVKITANAPEAGKVFDKWVIRSGDAVIADVNSAATTVTTKIAPTTIEATYKDGYRIVEGANGIWAQNSDGTLTFRANGDISKLSAIKVDGNIITSEQYTAASDSTVITLKNEYLVGLSVGTHTLTVIYNDGECSANFEIKSSTAHTHSYQTEWKSDGTNHWHECSCGDKSDTAAHTFDWKVDRAATRTETGLKHEECSICGAKRSENTVIEKLSGNDNSQNNDNTADNNSNDNSGTTDNTDNNGNNSSAVSPKTGYDSNMFLWIALLFISTGAVIGTTVFSKKKRKSDVK